MTVGPSNRDGKWYLFLELPPVIYNESVTFLDPSNNRRKLFVLWNIEMHPYLEDIVDLS
jgi:hypothetical protein